jgi:hypothetical protein
MACKQQQQQQQQKQLMSACAPPTVALFLPSSIDTPMACTQQQQQQQQQQQKQLMSPGRHPLWPCSCHHLSTHPRPASGSSSSRSSSEHAAVRGADVSLRSIHSGLVLAIIYRHTHGLHAAATAAAAAVSMRLSGALMSACAPSTVALFLPSSINTPMACTQQQQQQQQQQ